MQRSYLTAGVIVLVGAANAAPGTDRAVVLTYHDMVERRDARALWFDCTPAELISQLDWLAVRGASVISIPQLYANMSAGKPLPPRAVAITFADNYAGFYQHAWPILRARRIPVTLFVHTGFVGSKVGRPKMTWDQLRELKASGLVTIASQTVSHPADLGKLTTAQVRKEMVDSKQALDAQLSQNTLFVAYPNGKYDQRSAAEAKRAGYQMAFTENQKVAQTAPNLFEVPRYVHTKFRNAWRDLTKDVRSISRTPIPAVQRNRVGSPK
ncbi:MAG: polysaccharide deacetylase family protein [Fimbriimonas sp.]